MNVTQEAIDNLNARVTIEIEPEDYAEKVTGILNDYKKKVQLQGFRPGKVPFGVVKKMYGKSVLAEELNKILSESLNNHLRESEANILGQPLPEEQEQIELDFDKKFTFKYQLGLAPEFETGLTAKDKFTRYTIKVDDKLVEKYVRDFQRRYGDSEEVEVTGDKDMVYGTMQELGKNGDPKEGGISNQSTVVVEYVEHADTKKKLTGVKRGETIIVDPTKISKGEADLSAMLGVPVSELSNISKQFSFEIEKIYRIDPAPLNKELFEKVLGPNAAENEEEFRKKISEDLTKHLKADSDKKLKKDITDTLLERLQLQLPDEFLKRWLVEAAGSEEKPITQEDVDREYEDYSKYMRVQLIEGQIAKENEIKVEYADVETRIKDNIRAQFKSFGQPEMEDDMLNQFAQNYMQNQEQVQKVYDQLFNERLMDFYLNTVKLVEKEVSFDDFIKLASSKPGKGNLLDSIGSFLKGK